MRLKRKIPKNATTSMIIRSHTAKAVVDSRDVAVTAMAGKETTIIVVVVPAVAEAIMAVAEAIMAVVEVAYPNRLTRPNQLVTNAGWKTIGQRIVEPLNIYVSSIKSLKNKNPESHMVYDIGCDADDDSDLERDDLLDFETSDCLKD